MTSAADVLQMIKDNDCKFVDLRVTDLLGKEMHLTIPADKLDEDTFELGQPFDGSSFVGWRGIESSDMLLQPDPNSARMDPFREANTLVLNCDVLEPTTGKGYDRDPRSLARRAEAYLKSTGIGDTAYFGPEPEFFVFDSVQWDHRPGSSFFKVGSEEAPWSSGLDMEGGNLGHRNRMKGGYFPVSPVDSMADLRAEMCTLLEQQGVPVEIHHHEVGGAGQCEIGTRFSTLVERADWTQILKYTVWNVAAAYGKTATFMPKPVEGDNGSGMHVHQSIWKDGQNLFSGNGYAGLSEMALYYIGGVIKHARALNAITNPVRQQPEGPPHRSALPRSALQLLPRLLRAPDGRPRRHPEQAPSGRSGRQEPLRSAAGRKRQDPDRRAEPRGCPERPRRGPRVPYPRRRLLGRSDRRLYRRKEEGRA